MNGRTEVPGWCRTDLENAIGDAVMRWVRAYVGGRTREALSHDLDTVARDVITALQGVGVPFSGATGAGAEHERTPRRRVMVADPVRGEQLATAANGDAATTWRCEHCGATVHYWPFDSIPGAVCEYVFGETADYAWVAHAPRCVGSSPPMVCRTCGVTSENWRHDETAPVVYFTDNGQCHPCYVVSKGKPT